MVAGRATAADGIIALAGAANAITEYEGYKLINDEAVHRRASGRGPGNGARLRF